MGTATLTSGQKAAKTRQRNLKRKAKALAKKESISFDDAKIKLEQITYAKRRATRKANMAKKSKVASIEGTKIPISDIKALPSFAQVNGKQVVYSTLIRFAGLINAPLNALSFPGQNNEFEERLAKSLPVQQFHFIETETETVAQIKQTIYGAPFEVHKGRFPTAQQKKLKQNYSNLNFLWFDFMGLMTKGYIEEFKNIFSKNVQSSMVFAVTIGQRGNRKNYIPNDQVSNMIEKIASASGWQAEIVVSCKYQSDNNRPMECLTFHFVRNIQNARKLKIQNEIARLQKELAEFDNSSQEPQELSPQKRAWITRRQNAAKKA